MKILNKIDISRKIEKGIFKIESNYPLDNLFIDDLRIGLSINKKIYEVSGEVDLKNEDNTMLIERELNRFDLEPYKTFLAISCEKFSIPLNVIGIMSTRSKYARLGIDMMKSSFFISPGFGLIEPTPIIFEITTTNKVKNFSNEHIYAFVIFYEIDVNISNTTNNFQDTFPFTSFKITNRKI